MDLYKKVGNKRVRLEGDEKQKILDEWSASDEYMLENDYKCKRLQEYPSTDDLIIALWEKVVESRTEASDALEAKRQAIKTEYPKT